MGVVKFRQPVWFVRQPPTNALVSANRVARSPSPRSTRRAPRGHRSHSSSDRRTASLRFGDQAQVRDHAVLAADEQADALGRGRHQFWLHRRAGADRRDGDVIAMDEPEKSRSPLGQLPQSPDEAGGPYGDALADPRRCVGADQLSRSDATEAEAAPCWLDRPLLLAMAHVPEHPFVAGGGLEVA
jgi:hypothetical protein